MRARSSDDVELAIHDLGGDGPPLVLAHATGLHGRAWGPLGPALARYFRCWSFDFRGHGDASRPAPPSFEWRGFGDDVLAVTDALGLEQPFGFGHSQGATAMLLAEAARPGTFAALYLYEPVAPPPDPPPPPMDDHPLVVGALRRRDEFPSVDAAITRLASKPPLGDFHPEALRAYVEHGVQPLEHGGVGLKCRREDEAQVYRMGVRNQAFDHLHDVRCAVRVVRGARSRSLSAELARRQVAQLPDATAEELEGLGHFGPMEQPALVAQSAVTALLGR
jgi:pimeloyl-ACP methyl ester carboxylesterase